MPSAVLDSFALIAYLRDEPGGQKVEQLLLAALANGHSLYMTEVNYAECKYMTLRKQGKQPWAKAANLIESLPIEFTPADRGLSNLAADFKANNKISLADAYAAALAKSKNLELVTGDPEFKQLEGQIGIIWLPQ